MDLVPISTFLAIAHSHYFAKGKFIRTQYTLLPKWWKSLYWAEEIMDICKPSQKYMTCTRIRVMYLLNCWIWEKYLLNYIPKIQHSDTISNRTPQNTKSLWTKEKSQKDLSISGLPSSIVGWLKIIGHLMSQIGSYHHSRS